MIIGEICGKNAQVKIQILPILQLNLFRMRPVNFSQHVLPHVLAVCVFLLVTILFFRPVFFENKSISQGDIQQWSGSSKELRDYRDKTGEEGLWAGTMF
ncbi:MAG TPA: hypothetical protein DHV26_10040, partial [Cytophagales bacterium]|nr:hypothetical protein [Cytophagales bacterium]